MPVPQRAWSTFVGLAAEAKSSFCVRKKVRRARLGNLSLTVSTCLCGRGSFLLHCEPDVTRNKRSTWNQNAAVGVGARVCSV